MNVQILSDRLRCGAAVAVGAPLTVALFALGLAVLGAGDVGAQEAPLRVDSRDQSFQVVQVAAGLRHPWSLAFVPDGSMLVTERGGRLLRLRADGTREVIGGTPQVAAAGQGGLLDVVLHPQFANNSLVYLSYAERVRGGARTAVSRGVLMGSELRNLQQVFAMNRPSGTSHHFGSRLAFLPDGDLVVTIGDRGAGDRAQDAADHAGSVLRMLDDGRPSPRTQSIGISGAAPEVFSFGHRNPQGLAIEPGSGRIWVHEHGPRGGDEINIISGGANYGWPVVTFGRAYSGGTIGIGSQAPGYVPPLLHWTPSIAPSGMAFYTADLLPGWRGDLFAGALAGQHLRRVILDGQTVRGEEQLLVGVLGRIRDVRQGPNGALWLLTDAPDGGLFRIEPAP